MRFGYADPPYPGLARKYYDCAEVDHDALIRRLCMDYPDGWALSTSAPALRDVLSMAPPETRVACWVRGSRRVVAHRARNAWEPVLVCGGRPRRLDVDDVLDDVLIWAGTGRQRTHPGALIGMKSAPFCEWMFRQLGALQGDHLDDLFTGSGAVARAWTLYQSRVDARRIPSRLADAAGRVPTEGGNDGSPET